MRRLTGLWLGLVLACGLTACKAKQRPAPEGSGGAGANLAGGAAGQYALGGSTGAPDTAGGASVGGTQGGGSGGVGDFGGNGGVGNAGGSGGTSGNGGTSGSGGSAGVGGDGAGGAAGSGPVTGPPRNLFFSEYIEGTGSENKALEVYNAGVDWDLSTCVLNLYANGAAAPTLSTALSGFIASGATFTLCHSNLTHEGRCDLTNVQPINFNGNDVIELVCEDELQDAIGQIGDAPLALYWGTPYISTQNRTIRRKCEVTQGDRDATDTYDPVPEWDGFPIDDYDDFGSRACRASTPHPGQVVVTGLRRGAPVQVAFAVLADIGPNTELVFTDNPWSTTSLALGTGEDVLRVQFPAAIPAGTSFVWSADVGLRPNLGTTSGALRDFGAGDQVLLFQNTPQGPSFIFGASCTSQAPGFVLQDAGPNQSDVPARLTAPWNAWVDLSSGMDVGCVYAGDRVGGESFETYQRRVSDQVNWVPTNANLVVSDFQKLPTE
ncbi:MAG: hypothetical protein AB7K71_19860 [Polyangiaceae bacterium]